MTAPLPDEHGHTIFDLAPPMRHQWWCEEARPCTCLPAWKEYERTRVAGAWVPRLPPLDIVQGPPCLACDGKAERTDADGVRRPCAPGDGTRHPACRGNGGGRMSPAQVEVWHTTASLRATGRVLLDAVTAPPATWPVEREGR